MRILLLLAALHTTVTWASDHEVDKVLVDKSDRRMYLLAGAEVVREYQVSLGDNPYGHKTKAGDERTPEGLYVLDWKNPNSRFFRSIRISYPNPQDDFRARQAGYSPGGNIFIHGLPNWNGSVADGFVGRDWTDGCIAINNNRHMSEVWRLVKTGTPIEIVR